ncbi:glycerol-3-phosphate 1-O-acyltransferase PlsY [soil metagenome]
MPEHPTIVYCLGLLAAYLLGSIPFGLLIALAKGVDIRQHGSKNIGSANVGRTIGRKFGVLTFFLDAAKGFVPVLVAGLWLGLINRPDLPPHDSLLWLAFGLAAFLGHLYPVWLWFRGGKGVATGFGALLAVFPILSIAALAAILVWMISVKVTRYVGLSSCIAALSLPLFTLLATPIARAAGIFAPRSAWAPWETIWPYMAIALLLALFVVWRHRSNLGRMLAGTEPRVGQKKPGGASAPSGGVTAEGR